MDGGEFLSARVLSRTPRGSGRGPRKTNNYALSTIVMNFMRRKPVRRNYGKTRSEVSRVAGERIGLLLGQARDILPENKDRAKRYVELAKKISMRTKVRIPRESKRYLCKSCGLP